MNVSRLGLLSLSVGLLLCATSGASGQVANPDSSFVPHGTASQVHGDSIASYAPLTNVGDMLSGRVAGLQVGSMSGLAGAGDFMRIRGVNSAGIQGDPIIIVDGIRTDNSAGGTYTLAFAGSGLSPSRLDDLSPDDIESISILHGPASAAEYGAGSANGVILITTKRGDNPGLRWSLSAEQGTSELPELFPASYYTWGRETNGTGAAMECPVHSYSRTALGGGCVGDSITSFNPLNSPYSPFTTGSLGNYHVSVGGGTGAVRFFLTGGAQNEQGVPQLPSVFRSQVAALGLPSGMDDPNNEQQGNARATVMTTIAHALSLYATGAYLSTREKALLSSDVVSPYTISSVAIVTPDSANNYGYGPFLSPLYNFGALSNQRIDRVTGALAGQWRPAPWLVAHGTWSIDRDRQLNTSFSVGSSQSVPTTAEESVTRGTGTLTISSADIGASATATFGRGLRATTTVGLQATHTGDIGYSVSGFADSGAAPNYNSFTWVTSWWQNAGEYVEEELDIGERLFLIGGIHVDNERNIFRAFGTYVYPLARASLLVVDTRDFLVRLRGAYGESGTIPQGYPYIQPSSGDLPIGTFTPLVAEVTTEYEGGADLGLWGQRLQVGVTEYSRSTANSSVVVDPGPSLLQGIGTRNTGVEADLSASLIQARTVTWSLSLDGSVNNNEVTQLSDVPAYTPLHKGYPVYSFWASGVTYEDRNHDGIIESAEAAADTSDYAGSELPTREASLSTQFSIARGALTFAALWDYRGGFRVENQETLIAAQYGTDLGSNVLAAPLWEQARDAALYRAALSYQVPSGFYEDGSFVRFRELSATCAIPRSVTSRLRLQHLSVTGAVRNLALWTRYTGPDPEVSAPTQVTGEADVVDHNVRSDQGTVPLARYWLLRLNLAF